MQMSSQLRRTLARPFRSLCTSIATARREAVYLDPEFIRDLFAQFGAVAVRRMFSGAGIFAEGLMIGLIVRDVIYLKADDSSIPDFEREGSRPFIYTRGRKTGRPKEHALPYWRLPERLYDDPDELAVWAARALAIAERKKFAVRRSSKNKC